LNCFCFQDGLVRFSTEKYDTSDLTNLYAHLTNTSINKNGKNVLDDKDGIGAGCKWTLTQFKEYLLSKGEAYEHAWEKLWIRMSNVCILTLMLLVESVPKDTQCCFALYGFDLMIDSNLKPWMIEVNASPALNLDEATDRAVKNPLVCDTIRILNSKVETREDVFKAELSKKDKPRGEAARMRVDTGKRAMPGIARQVGKNRTVIDVSKAAKVDEGRLKGTGKTSSAEGRSTSAEQKAPGGSSTIKGARSSANADKKFHTSAAHTSAKPLISSRSTNRNMPPKLSVREKREQEERRLADPAHRESDEHGNFQLLFPFNSATAEAAWTMADDASKFKAVVDEVRTRELQQIGGGKNGKNSGTKVHFGSKVGVPAARAGGRAPQAKA